MGRRRGNHLLVAAELCLSMAIIILAVLLFFNTHTYAVCFPVVFGLAFLLCLVYLAEWIRSRVRRKKGMIIFLGIVAVFLLVMTAASLGAVWR